MMPFKYDLTPLEHLVVAVFYQCVIGLLTSNWWAGAAYGAALFIGREHAQAEERWIHTFGNHLRINLPWWGAFDYRIWKLGDVLDWLVPVVGVLSVASYVAFGLQ